MSWKDIVKRQSSLDEFKPSREEMLRKLYEDYLEYAKAWGARYFPMSVVDMTETEKYYYEEFNGMLKSLRRLDPVDNWREIERKFNVNDEFTDAGLRTPLTDNTADEDIIEAYNKLSQ